jgi:hypothetical protein
MLTFLPSIPDRLIILQCEQLVMSDSAAFVDTVRPEPKRFKNFEPFCTTFVACVLACGATRGEEGICGVAELVVKGFD